MPSKAVLVSKAFGQNFVANPAGQRYRQRTSMRPHSMMVGKHHLDDPANNSIAMTTMLFPLLVDSLLRHSSQHDQLGTEERLAQQIVAENCLRSIFLMSVTPVVAWNVFDNIASSPVSEELSRLHYSVSTQSQRTSLAVSSPPTHI